jgi:hypothetical protein
VAAEAGVTAQQRSVVAGLVDQAVRNLIAGRKFCPRCTRWLPRNEFHNGLCCSCEAIRVVEHREQKVAA